MDEKELAVRLLTAWMGHEITAKNTLALCPGAAANLAAEAARIAKEARVEAYGKALDSICMWPDAYRHLYAIVQAKTAPKGEKP